MALTDLSTTDTVAVVLGATIYATAQWVKHRMSNKPANPDQASAWAEGYRAGAKATATGYPEPNPYVGAPITLPGLDLKNGQE